MRKYVTIPDIRQYSSYKSVNARLVYMHACMGMDVQTRNYAHSWRQMAAELSMPLQQVRTALKQLEKDGLIATQQVTQQVTYGLTQRVTHKVTQIHILSINELDEATNEATNSPTNSPTNSQTNSLFNPDNNNKNTMSSLKIQHTHIRGCEAELKKLLEKVLKVSAAEAAELLRNFDERCEISQKTWDSEEDMRSHLVSWCEKHPLPKKKQPRTDNQARAEEYQRTKEDQEQQDQELTLRLEWQKYKRLVEECEKKEDKEHAAMFAEVRDRLAAEYNEKFRNIKAS